MKHPQNPGEKPPQRRHADQATVLLARLQEFGRIAREKLCALRAPEPAIDDQPSYREATAFRQKFAPKEGIAYGWVTEYARLCYEMLRDAYAGLDEKADSIIKHLTGGA